MHLYFPAESKICKYLFRETVMYSSCCLRCTSAPSTAVLDTAGTCLFTENKNHAENIGKHYCTPLANESVLVHPWPLYSTDLTPVPTCRIHNLQKKYRETVMYSSCCLRCTRAPLTAVLDPAGACPFPKNKQRAENTWKHACTSLANGTVLVHPSPLYSTHLTPVPSCRTRYLQTNIVKQLCIPLAS